VSGLAGLKNLFSLVTVILFASRLNKFEPSQQPPAAQDREPPISAQSSPHADFVPSADTSVSLDELNVKTLVRTAIPNFNFLSTIIVPEPTHSHSQEMTSVTNWSVLGLLPTSEATLKDVSNILAYISRFLPGWIPNPRERESELKADSTVLETPTLLGATLERLCCFSDQLSVGRTTGSQLLAAASSQVHQRFDGLLNCIADSHTKWTWMELLRARFFAPTGATNVGHPSHLARLTGFAKKLKATVKKSTRAHEVTFRVMGKAYALSAMIEHWNLIPSNATAEEIAVFNFKDCDAPTTFPSTASSKVKLAWLVDEMKQVLQKFTSQGPGDLPFEFPSEQISETTTKFCCGIDQCGARYAKDYANSSHFRRHRMTHHDSNASPGIQMQIHVNRPGTVPAWLIVRTKFQHPSALLCSSLSNSISSVPTYLCCDCNHYFQSHTL
jgi:hypothetical protein